jgi:hypothetical protein
MLNVTAAIPMGMRSSVRNSQWKAASNACIEYNEAMQPRPCGLFPLGV